MLLARAQDDAPEPQAAGRAIFRGLTIAAQALTTLAFPRPDAST